MCVCVCIVFSSIFSFIGRCCFSDTRHARNGRRYRRRRQPSAFIGAKRIPSVYGGELIASPALVLFKSPVGCRSSPRAPVNAHKAEPISAKRPYRCAFFIVITIINGGSRNLKQRLRAGARVCTRFCRSIRETYGKVVARRYGRAAKEGRIGGIQKAFNTLKRGVRM